MTLPPLEVSEPMRPRVRRKIGGNMGTIVGDGETRQRDGTMRQEIAVLWDNGEQEVGAVEAEITRL